MKKIILYSFLIVLLAACQSEESKTPANTGTEAAPQKTLELPYNAEYNEQTQKLELVRNKTDLSNLTLIDMIEALNIKYPEIRLELVSNTNHTAHVKIADAVYLSEDMGSAGAKTYMAEATYALTEIPGITAVDFAFKEGDHASPGVYTREDFKGFN